MSDNSVCRRRHKDINHSITEHKFRSASSKKTKNVALITKTRQKTLAGKLHNQTTFGIVLMLNRKMEIVRKLQRFSRSISNCYRFIFKCQEQTLFFARHSRPKLAIRHLRQTIRSNALDT